MPTKAGKIPFNTFLEVHWNDAVSNDGWVELSEDTEPQLVITRGWLVKETAHYITLAASVYPDNTSTVGSTQTIPNGMIVSKREVRVTNARSKLRSKVHTQPHSEELHREPGKG